MVKRVFFVLSLFVYSGIVYADQGFSCSQDSRSVGGIFENVTLVHNLNGTFDVHYTTQSLQDEKPKRYFLPRNLSCVFSKIDERVVSCHRSPTRAQPSSSRVELKKVTERRVRAISLPDAVDSSKEEDYTRELLILSIHSYSPKAEKLKGSENWNLYFEFALEECQPVR